MITFLLSCLHTLRVSKLIHISVRCLFFSEEEHLILRDIYIKNAALTCPWLLLTGTHTLRTVTITPPCSLRTDHGCSESWAVPTLPIPWLVGPVYAFLSGSPRSIPAITLVEIVLAAWSDCCNNVKQLFSMPGNTNVQSNETKVQDITVQESRLYQVMGIFESKKDTHIKKCFLATESKSWWNSNNG